MKTLKESLAIIKASGDNPLAMVGVLCLMWALLTFAACLV